MAEQTRPEPVPDWLRDAVAETTQQRIDSANQAAQQAEDDRDIADRLRNGGGRR